jgi:hypothetical protein
VSHYPPHRNKKTLWQNMPLGLNTQKIPAKSVMQSAAQARENCREAHEDRMRGMHSYMYGGSAKDYEMKCRYEKEYTIIGQATKLRSKDGVI